RLPSAVGAKDAYLLFQDLCYLRNGGQSVWLIGLTEITRTLILELIETILMHYASIFYHHDEFRYLLKERVSPLIIKLFSPGMTHIAKREKLSTNNVQMGSGNLYDGAYFPLIARLLRLVCILVRLYFSLLITECEIFLSLLIKLLEQDKPIGQRSLAIECLMISGSRLSKMGFHFENSISTLFLAGKTWKMQW
ncbi:unnamed protein product, partial [Didymodactylos carnosus]